MSCSLFKLSKTVESTVALSHAIRKSSHCAGDVVLCKTLSQLDTVVAWLACQTTNVIPLLVDGNSPLLQEGSIIHEANVKSSIQFSEDGTYSYSVSPIYDCDRQQAVFSHGGVIHVTSATTGNPKMVFRSKRQLEFEELRYIERTNISDNDVILSTAPLHHSYGFTSAMLVALRTGASLIDPGVILPRKILQLCVKEGVTILHGTPFLYEKLVEVSKGYRLGDNIRLCICSGGPMPSGLQKRFKKSFGISLLQQFGTTETGALTISEAGDPYNCVGRPLSGVDFVISSDINGLPWIHVSSPATIGYYLTGHGLSKLPHQRYRIGDLGFIDSSERVFLEGRGDDVAIIAGKKVSLKMVEEVVMDHPSVDFAKCTVNPRGSRQEILVRYVSDKEISPSLLIAHCQQHLSTYQIPRKYERMRGGSLSKSKSWKKVL